MKRMSVIMQHKMIFNPLNFTMLMMSDIQSEMDQEGVDMSNFTPASNMSKQSDMSLYQDSIKKSVHQVIGEKSWYPNIELGLKRKPTKWKGENDSAKVKAVSNKMSAQTVPTCEFDPTPNSSALKAFAMPGAKLMQFSD